MKKLVFLVAMISAFAANAACYGTGTYQTCTDNSGNSYSVNRIGDSTYMQGRNADTGSTWSQQTQRIGGSSFTTGRDADGNAWNSTTIQSPGGSTTYGTDSNGRSFTRTCNQFGCF